MSDWRSELNSIIVNKAHATRAEQENARFESFLDSTAMPALQEVAGELVNRHEREVQVRRSPATATICVRSNGVEELTFRVMKHFVQSGILPRAEARINRGQRFVKFEGMFRDDPQAYSIGDVTKSDVINCFLRCYRMLMEKSITTQGE